MEVAGLSLATVALASLFSTCLECFEYFQTAKSLQGDFEILLLRLDCQKERLLTWGEIVGISKSETEGRNSDLKSTKHELIERSLSSIATLLSDTEKLQKEYGVESVDSSESAEYHLERITSNRMHWFRKSYQRFATHPNAQKQSNILLRTKWAIRHKTKFETLISHIKEIVTNLHDILPISARSQDEMVHKDIALMSLPGLRRIKEACTDEYQAWSDVASAIVMASEAGTIDHRSVGEWLQDTSTTGFEASETITNNTTKFNVPEKGFELTVSQLTKFYFMFTSRCLSRDSDTGCDQNTLGSTSLKLHGESFLPGPNTAIPNEELLGKRIAKFMNVRFHPDDFEMLRYNNGELSEFQYAALAESLPLGNVYIYCAPCVYAIRTALTICQQGNSKYLQYRTRVDDRISAACCSEGTKIDRLVSLINMVKTIEATDRYQTSGLAITWIDFIDRVWIEQRVFQLEEEIHAQGALRSAIHDGNELFAEFPTETKETGVVILGELDQCFWMLQTPPFPWKARMPKETEIYKVSRTHAKPTWKRTYLGTYTPRAFGSYQTGNYPFHDQPRRTSTNGSVTTRWEPKPPAPLNLGSQESMGDTEKDSRPEAEPSSEDTSSLALVDEKD